MAFYRCVRVCGVVAAVLAGGVGLGTGIGLGWMGAGGACTQLT